MSNDRFPSGLSLATCERLYLLLEELGEAQQAIGKILRHGYESSSPFDPNGATNRVLLEQELGDVLHAIDRMDFAGDIRFGHVTEYADRKARLVEKYLHYQSAAYEERNERLEAERKGGAR